MEGRRPRGHDRNGQSPTRRTSVHRPQSVAPDEHHVAHPPLEPGQAAGVILVARDVAEVLEWHDGRLTILPRVVPDRDGREREQRRRFVEKVAAEAVTMAARRGWERAVVGGDDRLTGPLVLALPDPLREHTVRDSRDLIHCESRSLALIVQALLERQQVEIERRLVVGIRDAAMAAGPGALGVSEVLAALNEGRVMHLVYDPDVSYVGSIGENGLLAHASERLPMVRNAVPEPRLTERMAERALATGAQVTPVRDEAAALLAEMGGVAARLRW
jgi:hypothetical protein